MDAHSSNRFSPIEEICRRGKAIISNATRWDTFEKLIGENQLPESEIRFRQRYKKAPSFLTFHLGIKSEVLPKGKTMAFFLSVDGRQIVSVIISFWKIGRKWKMRKELFLSQFPRF